MSEPMIDTGTEWLVDASDCNGERLRDLGALRALFANIVRDLGLLPAAEPVWKVFGGEGGITGMVLLAESHLTIHTFPEHGQAAINLYCCKPRVEWDWQGGLAAAIEARSVRVRKLTRAGTNSMDERGT